MGVFFYYLNFTKYFPYLILIFIFYIIYFKYLNLKKLFYLNLNY